MNINQIKETISLKEQFKVIALNMVRQFEDEAKTIPQPWLSHWDNDNRVRVVMHEEVFNIIKNTPTVDTLALKYEEVVATDDRAAYKRYVVITPKHIEASF